MKAKRFLVIGISGAGKTYFARNLSEISHLQAFYLDKCIWKENWVEASQVEQEDCVRKILVQDLWIIEGFINPLAKEKLERVDFVLYLDYSGWIVALGGLRRW